MTGLKNVSTLLFHYLLLATTFSSPLPSQTPLAIVVSRCSAGDERRCYLGFDRLRGIGMVVRTFAPLRHVSDIFAPPVANVKLLRSAPVLPIAVHIERSVSL
ncbi:MAG: hypothetical protein GX216_04595 [Methanomicrobiales archaeon]|nr:hypothetical protein [Methanomicrobiales archaeon]